MGLRPEKFTSNSGGAYKIFLNIYSMDQDPQKKYAKELQFCLDLWEEQGGCFFGGGTRCGQCAVPYILWKLMTGEAIHGRMERLKLEDWRKKLTSLNDEAIG